MKTAVNVFMTVSTIALGCFLWSCSGPQKPAKAAPVILATPEIAQPTPEPTVDIAPTLQAAQEAVNAAQANEQAAIVAKNDALRAQLDAEATAQAAQIAQAQITATAEAESYRHAEAMQAGERQRAAELSAAKLAEIQAQAEADKAAAARIQAENEAKTISVKNVGLVTAALCAPIICLALMWAIRNNRRVEAEHDEAEDPETVQVPNGEFLHEVKIYYSEKARLRTAAIFLNGVFSRRSLARYGFSDQRADEITAELRRVGPSGISYATAANQQAPTILTDYGWRYLKADRPTTPPPAPISPISDNFTEIPHPTPLETAEGEVSEGDNQ